MSRVHSTLTGYYVLYKVSYTLEIVSTCTLCTGDYVPCKNTQCPRNSVLCQRMCSFPCKTGERAPSRGRWIAVHDTGVDDDAPTETVDRGAGSVGGGGQGAESVRGGEQGHGEITL